jgi:hypothetical protein
VTPFLPYLTVAIERLAQFIPTILPATEKWFAQLGTDISDSLAR